MTNRPWIEKGNFVRFPRTSNLFYGERDGHLCKVVVNDNGELDYEDLGPLETAIDIVIPVNNSVYEVTPAQLQAFRLIWLMREGLSAYPSSRVASTGFSFYMRDWLMCSDSTYKYRMGFDGSTDVDCMLAQIQRFGESWEMSNGLQVKLNMPPSFPMFPLAPLAPSIPNAEPVDTRNPKDIVGYLKAPYSYVSPQVVAHIALGMCEGDAKYGAYNFRVTPIDNMEYASAAMRHIGEYIEGRDFDKDSKAKLHSIAKALSTLTVLYDSILNDMVIDTRPPAARNERWLEDVNEQVKVIHEAYPQRAHRCTWKDAPKK